MKVWPVISPTKFSSIYIPMYLLLFLTSLRVQALKKEKGDRAVCRNFSKGGGGKFGVPTKEGGGGSLCEVLHPTLARGGENDTRGGKCPSPPPLNTALGESLGMRLLSYLFFLELMCIILCMTS